jgi:DNA replication protein DnaC
VPSFRWGRWLRPIVKGPCADCVAAAEAARVEALRPAVWPPPQPQPWICHTSGCDTELPHVWVDGTWHGPSWQRGRWSPPSSYLCPACTEAAEAAERERQIQLRIADTGLPVKLRGYRWDRVREYTTTRGERVRHADRGRITHAQFQRFQRELQPGTLGITPWNKRLAQTLRGLCTPGMPLQSWIVLGPVGTGKSTLLAATVAGLVGRGLECRYITEADLWALVRSQWGNTSRKAARVDVVQQLVDVPVLALDDLGTVEQPRPWHVDGMERLICGRYDHGRATLITTNATLQQLADTYGERVASRLVELVDRGQRYVRLGGPDWRTGTVRPDEAPPASSPTEQPADGSCSECGYSPCRCGGSRP